MKNFRFPKDHIYFMLIGKVVDLTKESMDSMKAFYKRIDTVYKLCFSC